MIYPIIEFECQKLLEVKGKIKNKNYNRIAYSPFLVIDRTTGHIVSQIIKNRNDL
jgi:hypothetical protein